MTNDVRIPSPTLLHKFMAAMFFIFELPKHRGSLLIKCRITFCTSYFYIVKPSGVIVKNLSATYVWHVLAS